MYVYKKNNYTVECPISWTVGFYSPDGEWRAESDHTSPEAAAGRAAFLNGQNPMVNRTELTYEELKDILEMSGVLTEEEAAYIVNEFREKEIPPTIGDYFEEGWPVDAKRKNKIIDAYCQYTSGKLGSTEEVEILRAELASARSACKDKDAKIKELEALNQK